MTRNTSQQRPTTPPGDGPTRPRGHGANDEDRNEVQLIATVTTPPERRVLPSGDEVVAFGVSVLRDEGGNDAIPIQVGPAPPSGRRPAPGQAGRRMLANADRLRAGDRVAVTGRIRRRWWDAGGIRRSRIEVSAIAVDVMSTPPP